MKFRRIMTVAISITHYQWISGLVTMGKIEKGQFKKLSNIFFDNNISNIDSYILPAIDHKCDDKFSSFSVRIFAIDEAGIEVDSEMIGVKAGLGFQLEDKNDLLLEYSGLTMRSLKSIFSISELIKNVYQGDKQWDDDWCLVSEIGEAEGVVEIIANSNKAKCNFFINANMDQTPINSIMLSDPTLSIKYDISNSSCAVSL